MLFACSSNKGTLYLLYLVSIETDLLLLAWVITPLLPNIRILLTLVWKILGSHLSRWKLKLFWLSIAMLYVALAVESTSLPPRSGSWPNGASSAPSDFSFLLLQLCTRLTFQWSATACWESFILRFLVNRPQSAGFCFHFAPTGAETPCWYVAWTSFWLRLQSISFKLLTGIISLFFDSFSFSKVIRNSHVGVFPAVRSTGSVVILFLPWLKSASWDRLLMVVSTLQSFNFYIRAGWWSSSRNTTWAGEKHHIPKTYPLHFLMS